MHGEPLMSHEQMRQAVFEHIEVGQRRHSGPDYLALGITRKIFSQATPAKPRLPAGLRVKWTRIKNQESRA